jgi:adenosine deaminase
LRKFYQSPETVSRLAYEAVADAAADNVRYLELRFSPQALARVRGFAFTEVVDWVIDAVNRAAHEFEIQVGLIVTLVRHDPLKTAKKAAEIAFDRHTKMPGKGFFHGVIGLDLAGDEVNYPMAPFRNLFVEAKRLGMGITIHAGEWSGAATVEEAITGLGADRLGHGVRAVENSRTIRLVQEQKITLEICLTSNIQTGVVQNIDHHPLKDLINLGVLTTLNTDDPCVSNSLLTDEYHLGVQRLNLGYSDLRKLILNAASAAFLLPENRTQLIDYFAMSLPPGSSEN